MDRAARSSPQRKGLFALARRLLPPASDAAPADAARGRVVAGAAPAAEQVVEQAQSVRAALQHLAARVAPDEAALVLLHTVFDADEAELAHVARRSEAAVRQALRRALRRLAGDPATRCNDAATEAALVALCLGAIATRRPAPLVSLLRERTVAAPAVPPLARSLRTRLVHADGALAQAVIVAGVVVCVLPLGVLQGDGAWADE